MRGTQGVWVRLQEVEEEEETEDAEEEKLNNKIIRKKDINKRSKKN